MNKDETKKEELHMKKEKLITRSLLLLVGAFFLGLGVSLSIRSMLGTSPISSIPYVLSLAAPALTVGSFTILFNVVVLLLQWAFLGSRFRWIHLLELPAVAAFGLCIDLTMWLTEGLAVESYVGRIALTVVSCAALAVGVYLMIRSEITCLPGDGLGLAIAERFGFPFSRGRVIVDSSLTILTIVLSLATLGHIAGVREGTIIAALLVGYFVSLLERYDTVVDRLLAMEDEEALSAS